MNNLQIFENSEFGSVRSTVIDEEPYFVGRDVAEILGYANPRDAISKHVDDEDKGVAKCDTLGGTQELTVINESGLYSLVLGSKLPSAKRFRRWVTSEVLPQIRKTGGYHLPTTYKEALANLLESLGTNEKLEAKIEADKPKVIFADAVSVAHTSILVGELAKLIKQNGVDIGQNRLFQWLRQNHYLMGDNVPTQKSMELGLFEVLERTINNADGSVRITRTTKVTGKGQQYFINKFLQARTV